MLNSLDTYTLRARVAPAFIVLIPVVVSLVVWVPSALTFTFGASSIVVSLGASLLVAQLGRSFGKRKEKALWESWGGPPTTRFLRHSNQEFNPIQRKLYHQNLQTLIPQIEIPSPEQETEDPSHADNVYQTCTRFLIGKTRDSKKYNLIFQENINYGFWRNLWGMKPIGISLCILGLTASTVYILQMWVYESNISDLGFISILVNMFMIIIWIVWVTPSSIKLVADAYAKQLLEASQNRSLFEEEGNQ